MAADVVPLPGMGLSAPVPSVEELAARLRSQLGSGPVVLVGHSQSCQVVVAAAQGDARVREVVLLGPTTDPRHAPLGLGSPWGLAGRWLWTVLREQPWQFPLVIAQWLRIGPRTMIALWRSAAPDRIEQRLPAVSVPVTVVRGSRDAICPADWARCLAEVAPCGRLVEVPGAAHMTVQTHPAAVAAVLAAATRR